MTESRKPTCVWLCCNPDVQPPLGYVECYWCDNYVLKQKSYKCDQCKYRYCVKCAIHHYDLDKERCYSCDYEWLNTKDILFKNFYNLRPK